MPGKSKAYRVANPRGIPAGIRILATDDREWFEGDEIAPKDLTAFKEMVAQGYIVGGDADDAEEEPVDG